MWLPWCFDAKCGCCSVVMQEYCIFVLVAYLSSYHEKAIIALYELA